MGDTDQSAPAALPRVAITYCTQCKWMLRAAYFAQELLSTFGTSIGEIALIPATGGIFTVYLTHKPMTAVEVQRVLVWDRKAEGGFPETKILKQRVRNHIEPEKKLGHSDTPSSKAGRRNGEQGEEGSNETAGGSSDAVKATTDPLVADAVTTTGDAASNPSVNGAKGQECEDCG